MKYSVGAVQCRHEKGQEYDDTRSRNKISTSRYFCKKTQDRGRVHENSMCLLSLASETGRIEGSPHKVFTNVVVRDIIYILIIILYIYI